MAGQPLSTVDRVLELVDLFNRDMQLSFERDGLTQARAHLLWALRGGPLTQRALADALAVTPRNVTGLVDGLVAAGHVVREPHPSDRRAVLVTPTPAGAALLDTMVAGYGELEEVLLGAFSARQVRDLHRALGVMNERLRRRIEEEWG